MARPLRRPLPDRERLARSDGRASRRLAVQKTPKRPPPLSPEEIQARVLHRDGLILVIDKPAGLAVHAGPSKAPNLEECFDALRYGLPRPPALAHRLDADTSGVLVLGRHPKALSKLGRIFSSRDTEKTYWAVVEGAPPGEEGMFDSPLLKVNTRSGWSVKVSDKGQTAVTRYRVLGRAPGMTWLELKPETGRTHQLRVHCAHAGCPIIADRLYGKALPGQQLHLHARAIVLPLSKNKPPIRVEATPPPHMLKALQACGYDRS
jgi:RluA family pseudouridine synthase